MHIIIKTQSIFNQRTARVGEFTYDKQGRMIITVAAMSIEAFCAVVAVESLCTAIVQKHMGPGYNDYASRVGMRMAKRFASDMGIRGKNKRQYNKERKALD